VTFILDEDDREAVVDLELEDSPTRMVASRLAKGGSIQLTITPTPRKNRTPLLEAVEALRQFYKEQSIDSLNSLHRQTEDGSEGSLEIGTRLGAFIGRFNQDMDSSELEDDESFTEETSNLLADLITVSVDAAIIAKVEAIADWFLRVDPGNATKDRLWRRSPDCLLFTDEDRTLQSAYTLDEHIVANPPSALANLLALAGIDLKRLWTVAATSQLGSRSTILLAGNQKLEVKFCEAWKQSQLTVHLDMDALTLNVLIKEDNQLITVFDERSAGLRMFVALQSFISAHGSTRPPILLIDEAETHLHVDAQADLVNTFMIQTQAAKIIYTTHSPGCLPPDLGTGIRAVLPDRSNAEVSAIYNSFWNGAAGYSPLMLAMGAGAAAFSPARFVVLAEGASEMLVLPSLIRAATGVESLGYQVAPGLSETPTHIFPELELEGARVAFLVDDDDGGKELKKRLAEGGVPGHLIVQLGAITLENLLDKELYRSTIERLLLATMDKSDMPELPTLEDNAVSWPAQMREWSRNHDVKLPSKIAVANRIVESASVVPSQAGRKVLADLHQQLQVALKLAK